MRTAVAVMVIALVAFWSGLPNAARADAERDWKAGYEAAAQGDYVRAARLYTLALEYGWLRPRDRAKVAFNRGAAFRRLGEYQQAIRDYSEALRLWPQFAAAYHNRGIIYHLRGDRAAAALDFRRAYDLAPADPDIRVAMWAYGLLPVPDGSGPVSVVSKADAGAEESADASSETDRAQFRTAGIAPAKPSPAKTAPKTEELPQLPLAPASRPSEPETVAPQSPVPSTVAPVQSTVAPVQSVAAPDDGRFLIHLASFRTPEAANRDWRRLRRRYGALLADTNLLVRRVDLAKRGIYYRVMAAAFVDRDAARRRCAALRARDQYCAAMQR